MKKLLVSLFTVFILALAFSAQSASAAYKYPNGKAAQVGDILVTSDGALWGLVGHTAIVSSPNQIMEITGKGDHPTNKSISNWFKKKNRPTKVVRINNKHKAELAGYWAHMYNPKATYGFVNGMNFELYNTEKTYCSKIVYQAYSIGSGVFPTAELVAKQDAITPYFFLYKGNWPSKYNPKLVYSNGMKGTGTIK
ncbi:hypothetical protein [Bacillus haynesii]|uniref:hypothetical protein n=1 Tax=Bacillus TaxID=1386 RepID=UPI00227DD990|nr:hypothetical protein [Bacillus haynesii]MCY7800819.1 hypothetical protein [Bacillus haynesii]MCY8215788.1 hypothetical protein [Bacillus haynesii]MCY8611250.1 hypothetical protein [Bacillus haynesii]MEC1617111.1 hypothetical protein [Bacillus haynesii]